MVHAPPETLALTPSSSGRGVDLDGRGVRFDRAALERILELAPLDEEGRKLFGVTWFDRATFDHGVVFDGASFSGPVSMTGAVFKGDARFGGATFAATADFSDATFEGQAWFVGATFGGPVGFRAARFAGPTWFQQASFAADASFDGATFSANATVSSATFAGVASFTDASFAGRARFDRSTAAGGWRLDRVRFRQDPEGLPQGTEPTARPVAPPPPYVERPSPAPRKVSKPRRWHLRPLLPVLAALVLLGIVAYVVLRPEASARRASDSYSFVLRNPADGAAVRWNPCEPIRYVVNPELAPAGGMQLLEQVVASVSAVTGIRFQSEGATTERVSIRIPPPRPGRQGSAGLGGSDDMGGGITGMDEANTASPSTTVLRPPEDPKTYAAEYQALFSRPSYQPVRYGKDRWAPVLLGWSAFTEVHADVRPAGIGAPDARDNGNGTSTYVSGVAMFNVKASPESAKATMMHELGHVVGLADVNRGDEVMRGSERRQKEWGTGDIKGLRRLGAEYGCVPTPRPA